MGTRNLTAVMLNGEYKIAQYAQWDGYPEGQGVTILNFLSNEEEVGYLKENLSKVRFFDAEGKDKDFIDSYEANSPKWSSDPDNRTPEQKYWFERYVSRNVGGEILENVAYASEEEILLKDSISFAGDSLFCEWGYVVDLDKNTFEVYEGFNSVPVKEGRFKSSDESLDKTDGYEPIKLVKIYNLDKLPTKKGFIKDLVKEEEE